MIYEHMRKNEEIQPQTPKPSDFFKSEFSATAGKSSVTLPSNFGQDAQQSVVVIEGLSPERTLEKIERRLMGQRYNYLTKKWEQYREPVMNKKGIGNFMATCQGISDAASFSNYDEKEIPRLAQFFVESNYPTFTIYHKEFQMDIKDRNIIKTSLLFFALSSLKNAKNAGHRNVVRGTMSEQVMLRALGGTGQEDEKKRSFLGNIFGWGKKK